MAAPTLIPIKGNWNKTNIHGTVPVSVTRSTELEAFSPRRGRVYDPLIFEIKPRPYYYARDPLTGKRKRQFKEFCGACGCYQVREAFYPDLTRRNGLRGICKTCKSEDNHRDYVNRKARLMNAA